MDLIIRPTKLSGSISAIPSKSQAHRLLICAAFSDAATSIDCPETNIDIEATVNCLNALGASINRTKNGYDVIPVTQIQKEAILDCNESGSTLRFMLPIVGALGIRGTFLMSGRLPQRPLSPLWEEMERMGCRLERTAQTALTCSGQLKCGNYKIAGNVSSQYITGLMFALALLDGDSRLEITGTLESAPYVEMTRSALELFGVSTYAFCISGSYPFRSPGFVAVEGDWSNAAFFLTANAMGNSITISGLNPDSAQGDKAVASILSDIANICTIDASDIPDLVPILAVAAAAKNGIQFQNIQRLRLKESDRVASVCSMLRSLGIMATADENTLTINPGTFRGGVVDSCNDHRIAMAAAIAATVATGTVTILNAQCVEKSYPAFWVEYRKLGGHYEQYLR